MPVAIHVIIILFIILGCFPQNMCLVTLQKQRITLSLPLIVIGQSAYSHHLTSNQHTPRHTNVTQTCLIYAKKWYWIKATSSWIMNKITIKTQQPTTTYNNRQQPTTTNNNQQQNPTTDNNRQQQPRTTNNNQQQPTTTTNIQQQPTTTDNNQQQPTSTNNNTQQPTTTPNNRQQPTTTTNNN